MNSALIIFYLAVTFFCGIRCAPAISSVHVSFVTGNKATQYSHGIGGGSSPLSHYTLPTGEGHLKQKRSISLEGGRIARDIGGQIIPTTTEAVSPLPKLFRKKTTRKPIKSKFSRNFHTTKATTTNPTDATTITITSKSLTEPDPTTTSTSSTTAGSSPLLKRLLRTRVEFVDSAKSGDNTLTKGSLRELTTGTSDILKSESKKPKDSKAVKRSPFIADNFDAGGITFPDFDEFGGEEFGSLRNFASPRGGRVGAQHSYANPEALSPDGVFLPPLPTEASDYADNDPYLSDPDTAKYAAQHPPFFAAYPHKRAMLSLNEQRVHNGLEPNILRSIRPYFAFFDAANPYHHKARHIPPRQELDDIEYSPQSRSTFPHSYARLFQSLEPMHLLYAYSKPLMTSWSIFHKK